MEKLDFRGIGMPEEQVSDLDATPEEAPVAKKKSKGPLPLIIIAAGAFFITIGVFSLFMGVFSPPPPAEKEIQSDSLPEQASETTEAGTDDQSVIDSLEQLLFGQGEVDAGDLDELLELAEEQESGMSQEDSLDAINWLEAEKAKLAAERKKLDDLNKKIDAREHQLKQLLSRVNELQSSRVSALAKLYDGMKASQVAPLIIKLTEEQAVHVLLNMKPNNAAKVLEVLDPNRAARISANMITLNEEK
jgi:flagellar motility protein MotE (MotC chaperone)